MREHNIVIYDKEPAYAHHLSLLLAKRTDLGFSVSVCSTKDEVERLAKDTRIHTLILGMSLPDSVQSEQRFRFTEHKETQETESGALYRYQSVDGIIERILNPTGGSRVRRDGSRAQRDGSRAQTVVTHREEKEQQQEETHIIRGLHGGNVHVQELRGQKKRMRFLAVYSPIHRCGKTTYAMALGKALAQKYQVLYLNLEGYAGVGEVFGSRGDNLADLIYYMKQEQTDLGMRIGTLAKKWDRMDYIDPLTVGEEIKSITTEEWMELFQQVEEKSIYQILILDLGDGVQGIPEILEFCDVVHIPVLADGFSQAKLLQFEENMRQLGRERILDHAKQLYLPEMVEGRWQEMMESYTRRMVEKGEVI